MVTTARRPAPAAADVRRVPLISREHDASLMAIHALLLDDVGMRAVPAAAARQFLTERAEQTARMAEQSCRLQEAHKPSPVGRGVPALENGSPLESLMNGHPGWVSPSEEFGQRPKPNFLAEELEQSAKRRRDEIAEQQALKQAARLLEEGKDG